MTYTRHSTRSYISGNRFNSRPKQFMTLIAVIIIGIIISAAMNAIPSNQAKSANYKTSEQVLPAQN